MAWLRGKLEIERTERESPKAVVYDLNGPLTDTRECYDFLEDVRGALREGFLNIILDLQDIKRVTSAGIGLIAACYTSAKNAGGHLVLVAVPDRARILLELVHLWDVVGHHDTAEEALQNLRS